MNRQLRKAKTAYEHSPEVASIQLAYCKAFAEAGYPDAKDTKCLVPWCQAKVRSRGPSSKNVCCAEHTKDGSYLIALKKELRTSFLHQNHQYYVSYDYDTERNCDWACDPYCRCGVIVNAHVTSIPYKTFLGELLASEALTTSILGYCVDRILHRRISCDSYDIWAQRGYYGQEVERVMLDNAAQISDELHTLVKKTASEQMEYVLRLEYQGLLPGLEQCDYTIERIKPEQIFVSNPEHLARCNSDIIKAYQEQFETLLPQCIVKRENDKYRLIDGYHRYAALMAGYLEKGKTHKLRNVYVIVATSRKV